MKINFSKKRFLLCLLCCVYSYSHIYIPDLPWSLYILSLAGCAGLLTVYMLANLDIILLKRYRTVNALALLYIMSVLFSVYINGLLSPYTALLNILGLAVIPFIEIQKEKKHLQFLLKTMMIIFCVLLIANDVLMVIMPGRFYGDGISGTFLLGNKFAASYTHMLLLLLVCILYEKNPAVCRYFPLMFLLVSFICYYMDCNTAVIGTVVFFLVSHLPERIQARLSRKRTVFVVMMLCALFIFVDKVFLIPQVRYFITEVLNRDITLTGRMQIYDILPKVIRARPLFGYGSSADIIYRYTGAFNAQNGFFDLVVANGIPSACIYVFLVTALIRRVKTKEAGYMLGLIYGYLIMSTVEMTYGTTLMLAGILLFTDSADYREDQVKIIERGG